MKTEKSCGGVVFTHRGGQRLYVIIRTLGGEYGFPKGHMEAGEDEQITALREIREETGLRPDLIKGFRMEDSYPLPNKPGVTKQVVYFLAEFAGQTPRPQPEEVSQVLLMPYEEAVRTLTFDQARKILTAADSFVRSQV